MKKNVCSRTEKTIRILIGLALFSLFFLEGAASWWGLLGIIPIATVAFGYCPISHMLGMDTCRVRPARAHHA